MQKHTTQKVKVYDVKKRTYNFALEIIKFVKLFPKYSVSADVIAKQLLRAATSIGANVIEAQASSSKKDFVNFHNYALKSANETKFWLELAKDSEIGNQELSGILLAEAKELANILATIILKAKGKRF